jgi:hypothetical protein
MSDVKLKYRITEIHTNCPNCKKNIELTNYVDFIYPVNIDIFKNTKTTVDAVCYECKHEFTVNLEY